MVLNFHMVRNAEWCCQPLVHGCACLEDHRKLPLAQPPHLQEGALMQDALYAREQTNKTTHSPKVLLVAGMSIDKMSPVRMLN
jgi:hypothetical protein